jgi:hypothetical protein
MPARITTSRPQIWVSSVVLNCEGSLDWSSYRSLVEIVLEEIKMGASEIIIDLSRVETISLAGMIGLYLAGVLLEDDRSLTAPLSEGRDWDALDGWDVIHEFCEAVARGAPFKRLRLVAPHQGIVDSLTALGMHRLVQIVPTVDEAKDARY